jgi:GAF domain-containing protein
MSIQTDHLEKIRDAARLAALEQTGLLYAPQSEALQRLTRLANKLLGADVSFITAVEPERQHILSSSTEGWPPHTALDRSICQYIVSSENCQRTCPRRCPP